MLLGMQHDRVLLLAGMALLALLMLAACGGEELLTQRADSFEGGALSSFGGTDGADSDARDVARAIANNRGYDFTPSGYTLATGAATSWLLTPSIDYGDGTGTLTVNAADAETVLQVLSNSASVTEIEMQGEFPLASAQAAIENPGSSFVVDWTISWQQDGTPRSLTAQQTLLGAEWTTL